MEDKRSAGSVDEESWDVDDEAALTWDEWVSLAPAYEMVRSDVWVGFIRLWIDPSGAGSSMESPTDVEAHGFLGDDSGRDRSLYWGG